MSFVWSCRLVSRERFFLTGRNRRNGTDATIQFYDQTEAYTTTAPPLCNHVCTRNFSRKEKTEEKKTLFFVFFLYPNSGLYFILFYFLSLAMVYIEKADTTVYKSTGRHKTTVV